MTESCLASFAKAYTDRFSTRAAGISPRLWLCASNHALSKWIRKQIGERYRGDNRELEILLLIAQEEEVLQSLLETKKPVRRLLIDYVAHNEGERLLREGIIDAVTGHRSSREIYRQGRSISFSEGVMRKKTLRRLRSPEGCANSRGS